MKTSRLWFVVLSCIAFFARPGFGRESAEMSAPGAPAIVHPPGNFIAVNGARLWYEMEGKGPAIVLIAGGPGASHDYFHPFFSRLARTHRVIYLDSFGRGKSERAKAASEYTFDRDVRDTVRVCQALNLGPAVLIGHAYGGMVAEAVALRNPELVKKLVLADTFYDGASWQAGNDAINQEVRLQYPEIWERLEHLRSRGVRSNAREHRELYAQVPLALGRFYDAAKAARVSGGCTPDVYYAIAGPDADIQAGGDIAGLDFRSQLQALKMPVLVLGGRFDRMAAPKFVLQFKAYAPRAELVMFEKSGNMPFLEEPDKFLATIEAFLDR